MDRVLIFLMCLATNVSCLLAQNDLVINTDGVPPITFYTGEDYGGNNQVWDITQSEEGLIYVATSFDIHEFDGKTWRTIALPQGAVPRNFAVSDQGVIYVGGINIMGFLDTDSLGVTVFQSIIPKDSKLNTTVRIEFVKCHNGIIHFAGVNSICVYDPSTEKLRQFETNVRSYPNFIFKDEMYYKTPHQGLQVYRNDTLVRSTKGDYFNGLAISDFVVSDDGVLGLSPTHVFHYWNEDTAYVADFLVYPELQSKFPYKLLKISEEYYAICYLSNGLVITDKEWNPILHLDESTGVNEQVFRAFLDRDNNLWLGTNFGLSVVELASAVSMFGRSDGITGEVSDFEVKDGTLYVATTTGLVNKSLKKPTKVYNRKNMNFSPLENSDIYNDDILRGKGPLLVKAYQTIGQIKNNRYERLYTKSETSSEIIYLEDSTYALSIGKSGSSMQLLRLVNGNWTHEASMENDILPKLMYNLKYDHQLKHVWGANPNNLFSFEVDTDNKQVGNYRQYSVEDGLPDPLGNWSLVFGDQLLFTTEKGLYEYDYVKEKFVKSDLFNNQFVDNPIARISAQSSDTIWVVAKNGEKGFMTKGLDGKFGDMDARIANVLPQNIINLYHHPGYGAFFGMISHVAFIPHGKADNYEFSGPAFIRQLDIINQSDTTVFSGRYLSEDGSFTYDQKQSLNFTYDQNAVRFTYAIPYFRHPELVRYAYRLIGYETEWSNWTDKTQKEYTNLSPGKYQFEVKAKNGFDTESEVGIIRFNVESPWYYSGLAYVCYVIVFLIFIYGLLHWNSRRLKKENIRLEEIIDERTSEIITQKETIEKSLAERESLLKEIHHRVKNNLQIIASLLYLQSGKFEDEDFKKVLEEGQGRVRSMALIHQKLYENDDLKSIPFDEYLNELVGEIRASFGMGEVQLHIDATEIYFDVDTAVPLGLIVNEIATNAFKYAFDAESGGSFSIHLAKKGDEFQLMIKDDGKGIPDEIDIRKTKSLGLRLVRMLSQQLEGEFEIGSDNGTRFSLKFAA
ncbi:MAG: ATP-binding protein [Cyclobacteriaceae bacterium]